VEVDRRLCDLLRQEWGDTKAFRLVEADLGRVEWPALLAEAGPRPVVAGNLPYVLTSTVLFALGDCCEKMAAAVLMVQREVAERLTAAPGEREYGVLSAVLGSLFAIDVIRKVPANVFWPRPDVASAVVRLVPREVWPETEYRSYKEVVKILFGQRRKKMSTLLRNHFDVTPEAMAELARTTDVDFEKRPEQLFPEQLRKLARALAARREK
jgi:16S rRNA (adenine1518-N6/adenine1519-N6)-dimethyltransferase